MRWTWLIVAVLLAGALALGLWSAHPGPGADASQAPSESPPANQGPTLEGATPMSRRDAKEAESPAQSRRVTLAVRLATGEVPPRAWIACRDEAAESIVERLWTPAAPTVEVPGSALQMRVESGRIGEWVAERVPVPHDERRLNVVLLARRCIVGRVVTAEHGLPLLLSVGGVPVDSEGEELGNLGPLAGRSNSDGWFRFDLDPRTGVEVVRFRVAAPVFPAGRAYAQAVVQEVEVGSGPSEVELRVPVTDRTCGVLLRVTDPEGAAIVPSHVDVMWAEHEGWLREEPVHVDVNTVWVPTGVFEAIDAPSRVQLEVATPFGTQRVWVEAKAAGGVVPVAFVPPGTVELTLQGEQPEGNGIVMLWPALSDQPVRLGAEGRRQGQGQSQTYEISAVQPGHYRVLWWWDPRRQSELVWSGTTDLGAYTVRPGPQEASLLLPPLAHVRLRGRAYGLISIVSTDGKRTSWTVYPPGAAKGERWSLESPQLPPGAYEAQLGNARQTFHVPGTSEITFDD